MPSTISAEPYGFCSVADCPRPACFVDDRYLDCLACGTLLCAEHYNVDHACVALNEDAFSDQCRKRSDAEFDAFVTRLISVKDDIRAAAETLSGQAGTIEVPTLSGGRLVDSQGQAMMGSRNVHLKVRFADDSVWLARVRVKAPFTYAPIYAAVVASEFATMRELKRIAPEYIPEVWWPTPIDGLHYFFVEYIPGRTHAWGPPGHPRPECAPRVIAEYARFLAQVTSKPYSAIGSLLPSPDGDGAVVGPELGISSHFATAPLGVYATARDRVRAKIDTYLSHLEEGTLAPPERLYIYLSNLEIRALVDSCAEMSRPQPTYITHGDDYGDHILVSERISVIDWENAYTAPLGEALGATFATDWDMGSTALDPMEEVLLAEIRQLGRPDMLEAFAHRRKYQYAREVTFARDVGWFRAVREAFGVEVGPVMSKEEWAADALVRFGEDEGLKRFLARVERETQTETEAGAEE